MTAMLRAQRRRYWVRRGSVGTMGDQRGQVSQSAMQRQLKMRMMHNYGALSC